MSFQGRSSGRETGVGGTSPGWRHRSLLLALVLGALGCAGPQRPGAVASLAERRQARVVMQRWDLSCGAAALATLLTYDLQDPVGEREVAAALLAGTSEDRVRRERGFSLLDLQTYAERRGYEASGYGDLTVDELAALGAAIVPVQLGPDAHFVVFRGLEGDDVALADPSFGVRRIRRAEFERAWRLRIAFVVSPRGLPAPTASDAPGSDFHDVSGRALERTLMRQSGLVLPAWTAEVGPELEYVYGHAGGRRDALVSSLAARLGLPFASEVALTAPWVLVRRSPDSANAWGPADASVAVSRLLVAERRLLPSVIARGSWKTTSGSLSVLGAHAMGSGAHAFEGQLAAIKRDEPLVLALTGFFDQFVTPAAALDGTAVGGTLSAYLAVTPASSLGAGLHAALLRPPARPSADVLRATASLGASTLLAPRLLMSVEATIGLTPAAPDLGVAVALPWRFN